MDGQTPGRRVNRPTHLVTGMRIGGHGLEAAGGEDSRVDGQVGRWLDAPQDATDCPIHQPEAQRN